MTTEDIALPSAIQAMERLGQATAVEQSRAVAQVQAAIFMARQFPRSQQRAINEMRDACGRIELARRAFFSFRRAGQNVNGASVHLARELARIWGNLEYGLNELSRDDAHGQSEMQAYAWDMETNARSTRTFIVEHGRDTKEGRKKLTELRDIAENNNNFGSRNMREMIFAVLPRWFTDMAEELCRETLDNGGGDPLPLRIDKALAAFAKARVTREMLEDRVGHPVEAWTNHDISDLEILYGSLVRKEISRDEAFPAEPVTAAELTGPASPASASRSRRRPAPTQAPEHINPETGEVDTVEAEFVDPTPPAGDGNDPWADQ